MTERSRPRAMNCAQYVRFISTGTSDITRQIQHSQAPDVIDNAIFRVDNFIVGLHGIRQDLHDEETFTSLNQNLHVSIIVCVHYFQIIYLRGTCKQ